jgi:hypothetical protein
MEQNMEWNTTLYSTFIDFEQAFDSLQHENMWKVMAKYGIPVKIINLIKNMYEGYSCQVIYYGKLTHSFPVINGVWQGCIISSLIFILVIIIIIRSATALTNLGRLSSRRWQSFRLHQTVLG